MGGPGTPPFWRTRNELCTVLKRIGFFCFPIKHSTHTQIPRLEFWPRSRYRDIGLFCFPIKHSTHTVQVRRPFGARGRSSVRYEIRLGDLKENWFLCFPIKHSTHICNAVGRPLGRRWILFWDEDYGWGVRVRRPFGARRMSSVWYGTRLGDLKENCFLCFPIKHSTHTQGVP